MLQLRLPWLRRRIAEGFKLYGLQLEQMTFITGVQHLGRTRFVYGNKSMEGIWILDDFGFLDFWILGFRDYLLLLLLDVNLENRCATSAV